MKKIKFSVMALCLCAIFGFGLLSFSRSKNVYAVSASTANSYYLVESDGVTPYKSNIGVGTTSGYGDYVVGEKNIELNTYAEPGFQLLGWLISLEEQASSIFLTPDDLTDTKYIFTTKENADGQTKEVESTILFEDLNDDGKFDAGSFVLNEVFEDLKIEPVFDYLYYKVEITNFVNLISLPSNQLNHGDLLAYYNSSSTIDGYLKLAGTIVKDENDRYFYVGDIYLKDGVAYSKHIKQNAELTEEYIDSLEKDGNFRLGDTVELKTNVDIKTDVEDSVNIDVTSALLNGQALTLKTDGVVSNYYETTADTLNRTSSIKFCFDVEHTTNLINNLTVAYDSLFVVTIKRLIDGVAAVDYDANVYSNVIVDGVNYTSIYEVDGEFYYITENKIRIPLSLTAAEISNLPTPTTHTFNDAKDLFKIAPISTQSSFITIQNHFSAISETQYLAKNNKGFKVSCSYEYSEVSNGARYVYYTFDNIDGFTASTENIYSTFSGNQTVNINYVSKLYNVEFKTLLVDDGVTDIVDLNSLSTLSLKHANSLTITENAINTGYNFIGYSLTEGADEIINSSIDVKINRINPENKLVYLCYEYVDYTLEIRNLNNIHLLETPNEIYPLSALALQLNRNNELTSKDLTITNTIQLNNEFRINDIITLIPQLNEGFNFYGFNFGTEFEYSLEAWEANKFNLYIVEDGYVKNTSDDYDASKTYIYLFTSFDITEELVLSLTGTTITLYAYEDFKNYSLTYYIQELENVIMASISATAPASAEIVEYNVLGEDVSLGSTTDKTVSTIIITKLKYQDVVTITSEGLTFTTEASREAQYMFNYFTTDNKIHLEYDKNGEVYSHTAVTLTDQSIEVVYSLPISQLYIQFNTSAYDSSMGNGIVVSSMNLDSNDVVTINPLVDGQFAYEIEVGRSISVSFDKNGILYGYKFNNFNLTAGNASNFGVANDNTYTFPAVGGVHVLTINFETIKYHIVVEQYGAGLEDGTRYNFGTEEDRQEYVELSVENKTITFNKPVGYYVKSVKTDGVEYSRMNETVAYDSSILQYTYTFSTVEVSGDLIDEFKLFVETFKGFEENNTQVIILNVYYEIYKYTVSVGYYIDNYNNIDRIIKPTMELTYTYDSEDVTVNPTYIASTINFNNIPYGSIITITVDDVTSTGVELKWFTDLNKNRINKFYNENRQLIITNLTSNQDFYYRLHLTEYNLVTNYSSEQGSVSLKINELDTISKIKLFDKLQLDAIANRSSGYMLDNIIYSSPIYTEYVYEEESWNSNYENLYILKRGVYCKNTSDTYNPIITYYEYSVTENIVTQNALILESFNPANFHVVGNSIEIVINFKPLEVTIINKTSESSDKLTNIDRAEYAIYSVVSNTETITVLNTVTVEVQINEAASDGTRTYNLTNGLYLQKVTINGVEIPFEDKTEGAYILTIVVSNYITNLNDNNEFILEYKFKSNKITATVNSNAVLVDGDNAGGAFYPTILNLGVTIDGSSQQINAGKVSVNRSGGFLKSGSVYWAFNNAYVDYFKITSFNAVLTKTGELLTEDLYATYGIGAITKLNNNEYQIPLKMIENITITLIVQPIMYFEGNAIDGEDYTFNKIYKCAYESNQVVGKSNALKIGTDISLAKLTESDINLQYFVGEDEIPASSVVNVGEYNVKISFNETASFAWLKNIVVPNKITLIISPMQITISANNANIPTLIKQYDGTNNYAGNKTDVLKYLTLTDGKAFQVGYDKILLALDNYGDTTLCFNTNDINIKITQTELDIENGGYIQNAVSVVSELLYNLKISNIKFVTSKNNNNFVFNSDLIQQDVVNFLLENVIKIVPKELQINFSEAKIKTKVYDGTTTAQLTSDSIVTLTGAIGGDIVEIDLNKLVMNYNDGEVGENKTIVIDATIALTGMAAGNYTVNPLQIENQIIYPYSVSCNLLGLGEVVIYNERGLTDYTKADLIPIGATLEVMPIYNESSEFIAIYNYISSYISRTNIFVIGYKITFKVHNQVQPVSNELFISAPYTENASTLFLLSGNELKELSLITKDSNFVVDLSQTNLSLNTLILIKHEPLLKLWQIILIVVGSVVIVGGVVTTIVVLRIKKTRKDSLLETI